METVSAATTVSTGTWNVFWVRSPEYPVTLALMIRRPSSLAVSSWEAVGTSVPHSHCNALIDRAKPVSHHTRALGLREWSSRRAFVGKRSTFADNCNNRPSRDMHAASTHQNVLLIVPSIELCAGIEHSDDLVVSMVGNGESIRIRNLRNETLGTNPLPPWRAA